MDVFACLLFICLLDFNAYAPENDLQISWNSRDKYDWARDWEFQLGTFLLLFHFTDISRKLHILSSSGLNRILALHIAQPRGSVRDTFF